MDGFYGRVLHINLTETKYRIVPIDDNVYAKYLGGKGLASYLLYTFNPEGVDPLSPANCLIFATGPATGSLIWGSSRYGVFTKSPQTGLYAESYAGGKVPEAIDATGFDAIIITGKSTETTLLEIDPDGVCFHDAGDIRGMDTFQAEDAVNQRLGGRGGETKKSGAVVIGPAGENLVRFAVINNDYWRSAGRTGVGTVFGSKNLKAIFFKGDKKRPLFDKLRTGKFAKELTAESKKSPIVWAYRTLGTPMMVATVNQAKAFPTRYWSESFFGKWENISGEALHERCQVEPHACAKCFIACGRMTTVLNGRHSGLKLEGPEYETIFAFGGLCLIESVEEIVYLNNLCDQLGIDTITAGNLCGFAIEASLRGKIDLNIDYGDVDAIAGLLKMIAKREGVGDILARGIRYAAKTWDLEDIAVHVKGLELPGYDPRVLKGNALAFATADRGACHLRATFHKPELSGMIDPVTVQGKADLFVDFEDRLTLADTLILCRFYRDLYPWERIGDIIEMTTGLKEAKEDLQQRAAEISNLVRCFNLREGMKPDDDDLPERFYKESLNTGHGITRDELETMLQEYYDLRGWDKNGIPATLL